MLAAGTGKSECFINKNWQTIEISERLMWRSGTQRAKKTYRISPVVWWIEHKEPHADEEMREYVSGKNGTEEQIKCVYLKWKEIL